MCHHSLEKVFQLASATFSRKASAESVAKNLASLVALTNRLSGADVGLEFCTALQDCSASSSSPLDSPGSRDRRRAPVTYIAVTETLDISMGVFVIRAGENIPLHDHPGMHGIIKCLSGQLKITSFTRQDAATDNSRVPDRIRGSAMLMEKLGQGELFLAEQLSPSVHITPESSSCVLEPTQANIHRIESVGGPAAFLDILAPPYNIDPSPHSEDTQERDCNYFRVLPDPGPSPSHSWLLLSNAPDSFYCDTEHYRGPNLGKA